MLARRLAAPDSWSPGNRCGLLVPVSDERLDRADDRVPAPTRWVAALIVPALTAAFVVRCRFPGRLRQL